MPGICFRPDVQIDVQIDHLSSFSTADPPAVTRILFTPEDVAARKYVKDLMTEAGLAVRCTQQQPCTIDFTCRTAQVDIFLLIKTNELMFDGGFIAALLPRRMSISTQLSSPD